MSSASKIEEFRVWTGWAWYTEEDRKQLDEDKATQIARELRETAEFLTLSLRERDALIRRIVEERMERRRKDGQHADVLFKYGRSIDWLKQNPDRAAELEHQAEGDKSKDDEPPAGPLGKRKSEDDSSASPSKKHKGDDDSSTGSSKESNAGDDPPTGSSRESNAANEKANTSNGGLKRAASEPRLF